jgi:BirA family biotin operon repressor/biotin-[acetyl-CoA-carboxylase] ligase
VRVQPDDPPAPTLALVAAVALHDTLAPLLRHPRESGGPASSSADQERQLDPRFRGDDRFLIIKWPNDILASNAKLAGILLERSGDAVVIGFGANLAHHPDGLERPVTSIAALVGTAPDPVLVAAGLADSFAQWLSRWRSDGLEPVRHAWLAAAHPVGTRLSTAEGEGAFDGLEPSGALRLRLVDGSLRLVHAGDVFLL